MFKFDRTPIVVVVRNGRYQMHSHGPTTARTIRLANHLQRNGGISDTVPNGTYFYNVITKGFKILTVLEPADDETSQKKHGL